MKKQPKKNLLPKSNHNNNDGFNFNKNPETKKNIELKIQKLKKHLKEFRKSAKIAHLVSTPSQISIKAWQDLIKHNPVLLGNTTESEYSETTNESIEKELVFKMIDLYNAKDRDLTGYSTTGSTEGNIFSAWLARDWLRKKKIDFNQIRFLSNNLTHYSIRKSAKIVGIKNEIIAVNEKEWNLDCFDLSKKIKKLIKKDIKGFIIPLTLGYTLTGTDDNIEKTVQTIRAIKKEYKHVEFFCWIDAAMSGLINPFTDNSFSPFKYSEIKALAVDFHKFGHTPCPAGLVLHRRKLLNLIAEPIDFLSRNDNTLLSTRTAISPVASLLTILSLGRKGFQEKIQRNLKFKEKFLNKYKDKSGIELITSKDNLVVTVLAEKEKDTEYFKDKYSMFFKKIKIKFTDKTKEIIASKIYFINF